jgi:hypothetical protein
MFDVKLLAIVTDGDDWLPPDEFRCRIIVLNGTLYLFEPTCALSRFGRFSRDKSASAINV